MEILQYSDDNLAHSLSNKYTPKEVIAYKNHFIYLKDYLGSSDIDAKTIVIESDYISKDFLHDYVSYYALCFENYPKFCNRVHFFKNSFTIVQFRKAILSKKESQADFWENYIGFIVVKPIPVTTIGYTVLKTY